MFLALCCFVFQDPPASVIVPHEALSPSLISFASFSPPTCISELALECFEAASGDDGTHPILSQLRPLLLPLRRMVAPDPALLVQTTTMTKKIWTWWIYWNETIAWHESGTVSVLMKLPKSWSKLLCNPSFKNYHRQCSQWKVLSATRTSRCATTKTNAACIWALTWSHELVETCKRRRFLR